MFRNPYAFRYCNKTKTEEGGFVVIEHKLTFFCRFNHQYIVNVEEYPHEVFVVKFHLKSHSDSERRYQLLTEAHDPFRVIGTVLHIMLYFYKKYPYASFGFIGSPLEMEGKTNTKRFRVYRQIMANYFSPVDFQHYLYAAASAYLMLNRHSQEENLLPQIEQMFSKIYLLN